VNSANGGRVVVPHPQRLSMDAQFKDPAQEIKRLQRCISDLVSVLALPATWSGNESSQIFPSLLDTLLRLLQLDLVYVRLKGPVGERPIEIVRADQSQKSMSDPVDIHAAIGQWFGDDPQMWPSPVRKSLGNRDISFLPLRLGLHAEIGLIVAGSERADFPVEIEKLVLTVAANQAAIGLQEARLLSQQKRLASELDERVTQRTRQLQGEESARRYSEERHRVVVETASDAIVSIDDTGLIVFANPATATIFGHDPAELVGKPLTILMPEYMRDLHRNGFKRYLATGQRHLNWQAIELTALRKNGEEFSVEISFGELNRDGHKIFTGILRDISKRKQAEQALQRSEAFLAEGQRLGKIGCYSWRVATSEITWSEQLYHIFGFEIGAPVTPEMIRTRVHPEDVSLYEKMVEDARNGGNDFEWQYRLLLPDNSTKYLHAVARATRNKDGQLEYIAAIQDVTERRLSQEALDKARSELAHVARVMTLGTLTASIAHEVRQPITAAVTDAKTCARWLNRIEPDVGEAREATSRLVKDLIRASEIISRISSLFKKEPPKRELVDVNELVEEMIVLLRGEARTHSISIQHDLAGDLPQIVADRVQVQQVLMNLMLNGLDAMKGLSNPGVLRIISRREEIGQILVSVSDTGVGLPPEHTEKIFAAFFTSKAQGTGMGLAISRSIIESHGGRLWATSHSGPGATFQFTLPIEDTEQQAA
jgi:PAS domain S-box-containing protein